MCANHFCGHSLHGKPAAKLHRSCAVSLQSISKFGSEVGWKGEGYHTYLLSYYGFRASGCLGNPLDIQVADISNESLPCRTGSDATFFSHGFGSFGSKVRGLFRSMVPKLYNLYII